MNILTNTTKTDPSNHASETLLYEIKSALQKNNTEKLLKVMGYACTKNGLKTLEKFLACNDICHWLRTGNYDFHCTSKDFLEKLSSLLEVNPQIYEAAIDNCVKIEKEYKKIKDCYIFVNTDFHRTTQPIFILAALEDKRNIYPDKKELMFKTDKQIFENISKLVRKHYIMNKIKLFIWGKIDNYVYHHFDGNDYVFDRCGCLVNDVKNISEGKATISIKGKNIPLSIIGN